jgi:hypothetical protein
MLNQRLNPAPWKKKIIRRSFAYRCTIIIETASPELVRNIKPKVISKIVDYVQW